MRTAVHGFQWQRKSCCTSALFRRGGVGEGGWSISGGGWWYQKRQAWRLWNGLPPGFDQQRSRSLCVTGPPGRCRPCHPCSSSHFLPPGQRRFISSLSFALSQQCWLSFSCFSFFPLRSLLSQPFVSPAFDSAGHSMSPSWAPSRKLFPSLSQSCPSGRQLCHSQFPFRTRNGIQRRAQVSPSPSCPMRRGRSL